MGGLSHLQLRLFLLMLEPCAGIEPDLPRSKRGVHPLHFTGQNWKGIRESNSLPLGQSQMCIHCTYPQLLAGKQRIELYTMRSERTTSTSRFLPNKSVLIFKERIKQKSLDLSNQAFLFVRICYVNRTRFLRTKYYHYRGALGAGDR